MTAFFVTAGLRAGEPASSKPDPLALIKQMRVFFASLNSVACEIDYVRVLKSARLDNERRTHFDAAFERPNLLSIQMKDGDSVTYAWIGDGNAFYTYMAGIEKYTTKKSPATLEEGLNSEEVYVVRPSIENAFLIDELVQKDSVDKLPAGGKAMQYLGVEDVGGEKAHHVRLLRDPANWELWISAGPTPLPLKIYSPLSTSEPVPPGGKTEFTVVFSHWLPDVKLDPRVFQFDQKTKARKANGFLPEEPPHPLLNHPAPPTNLTLLDGRRTTLAAHKGRDIVVLDFWALTCMPCIGMLPKVDAVAARFKGRGVVFYAMNENDSAADIREFLKLRGINLTATLANKAVNFPAFKIDAIPRTIIIDKKGIIRIVHGVQANDFVAELSEQLEVLLKE